VNLYTWRVQTLAKPDTIEKRYQEIIGSLDQIMTTLEDLMEDPLFVDNIHGEQELSLDLTLELLETITRQFEPDEEEVEDGYPNFDDTYDTE
jgi:hypothetical protein